MLSKLVENGYMKGETKKFGETEEVTTEEQQEQQKENTIKFIENMCKNVADKNVQNNKNYNNEYENKQNGIYFIIQLVRIKSGKSVMISMIISKAFKFSFSTQQKRAVLYS